MSEQAKKKSAWVAPSASTDRELSNVTGGVVTWDGVSVINGQKIAKIVSAGSMGGRAAISFINASGHRITRVTEGWQPPR